MEFSCTKLGSYSGNFIIVFEQDTHFFVTKMGNFHDNFVFSKLNKNRFFAFS